MSLDIQKSPAERIVIVFIIVSVIMTGLIAFIAPEALHALEGKATDLGNVVFGLFAGGMGIYGLLIGRKREWFGEHFVIDDECITKTMPSGKSQQGKWTDLIFVSGDLELLGFEDGTAIDLSLLSHGSMKRIVDGSGPECLFTKAWANQRRIHTFTKVERLTLGLFGLSLIVGIGMVYGMPRLNAMGLEPAKAYAIGLACAVFIASGFMVMSIVRYVRIDLKVVREKRRFLRNIRSA